MKVWNSFANNKMIDETIKKAKEKTKKALFGSKEVIVKRNVFDVDLFYDRIVRKGLRLAGVIKMLDIG